MLNNIHQRLERISHRPYRHTKPVAHTLLSMLVTVVIFMSSLGVSPTRAAPITGQGFIVTPADLTFILRQIKIAEAHAIAPNPDPIGDPGNCQALLGTGPNQLPSPLLSFGLRTVNGSCNNLVPGQENFGAADQVFPRLASPVFKAAEDATAFGGSSASSYAQTSGAVADSQPRLISNLIVDQTSTNPAAIMAAGFPVRSQGSDGMVPCATVPGSNPPVDIDPATPAGCVPAFQTLFIENVTTDVGLSPPFNSMFTFFGQFFDHGLDKITNGGNGAVFVPLKGDDPLVAGPDHIFGNADDLPASLRFMVLTRGTIKNDPVTGLRNAPNTDTPFIDQSQTYTSHSSHQVFTREYINNSAGRPVATGKFLHRADGGMPSWAMVKAQAADVLGLELTDANVGNIPMIAADAYGNFIPGPARGLPQYVTAGGLVEGNTTAPLPVPADAIFINTAFLNDIAHSAAPTFSAGVLTPDIDDTAGKSMDQTFPTGSYDDELLDLHFIAGDGRVNENIALTAMHQIFHSEHDRLVDDITATLNANPSLLVNYQAVNPVGPNKTFTFGERLFQAARFVTEMQYQHLVFEEFGRKIQPAINPFEAFALNQTDVNPAITAEFAHAVYRFGHSMLTDTLPRKNEAGSTCNDPADTQDSPACLNNDITLLEGFLNPAAYYDGGSAGTLTSQQAAGSIIMGLSDQSGNEIDEFVADTLRNNLLGLPIDLPSLNMARARSEGVPSLNNVRKQVFAATNDSQMTPYRNWVDYSLSLKHPESLVNFVAAYGKHPTVTAQTTLVGKRVAADQLVNGTTLPGPDGILFDDPLTECSAPNNPVGCDESADNIFPPADLGDFMFSTGAWANDGDVSITGLDDIDLWVGGLAERTNLFGGLLGTTFNYVFENQMTNLQNGDRFYYLARTPGMNLRSQLEGNSFAELVTRNTNTHSLKADAFATSDCKFELGRLTWPAVSGSFITGAGSVNDDPFSECDENRLLVRMPDGTFRYRERNSVDPSGINGQSVFNGNSNTANFADLIYGGNDNDTFWGGDGDDIINGGGGDDVVLGGFGNDIITDIAGDDVLKGGPGNDAIDGGVGLDIILGGDGKDFTNGGANSNETFGGPGDDFMFGGQGSDFIFGDGGDDWEEGGDQPDLLIGDSSTLFFDDSNLPGHDILIGQGGDDDYDGEGGDDIFVTGPGVEKNAGAGGYDWSIGLGDPQAQNADLALQIVNAPPANEVRDRFNELEALSGWKFNDILRGDDIIPSQLGGGGFIGCDALDQAGLDRIAGLDALVPPLATPLASVLANSVTNHCLLSGDFVWGEGNILLGGDGSDQLEGRGADDILDGDHYLNVRLSIRDSITGLELGSTDLMENKAVTGNFGQGTTGMTLQQAVFAGLVDPGNIVAVREILLPTPLPSPDCSSSTAVNCDTALFSGAQAEYTVTPNLDGSVTVNHTAPVGGGGGGLGDGIDTLWNMEQLSFCDLPGAVRGTCDVRSAPVPIEPGGPALAPIARVTASLSFGSVNAGSVSAPQSITVNNTGNADLVVSGISVTGPAFSVTTTCGTVVPGGDCTVTVTFAPTTTGEKLATLVIAHNAAPSSSNVALSGTGLGPVAELSQASLAFAPRLVNTTSATQSITVNNTGTANLVVSGVSVTDPAFSATTACGSVAPGRSCTVNVAFKPTTIGAKSATVNIAHNAAGSLSSIALIGAGTETGLAPLAAVSLTPLDFSSVQVNATSTAQAITVSNSGTANLMVSGITMTGTGAVSFLETNNCGTVAPSSSCIVNIAFKPTAFGAKSATVNIFHNAAGSSSSIALTGNGLGPLAAVSQAPLAFGSVNAGSVSSPQTITVSNTGNVDLLVSGVSVTGVDAASFSATTCGTVAVGNTCTINVSFAPATTGAKSAEISIAHNSNNVVTTSTVAVGGTGLGPMAAVSQTSLAFGGVNTGIVSGLQSFTVSNTGNADLVVSDVSVVGVDAASFSATHDCGTVAAGTTCTINVSFAPTTIGAKLAEISIAHNSNNEGSSSSTVAVSGTGLAPLAAVSPTSLAFGSARINTTSTLQAITVRNTGNADLTVSGISVTGVARASFSAANTCRTAVAPDSSCTVNVAFKPTSIGAKSAVINIFHNSNNRALSSTTVPVSGTAITPPLLSVQAALNFGVRRVNTNTIANVTVINRGPGALLITSVTSGGAFTSTRGNCPASLAVGGSCMLSVTFRPTVIGQTFTGTLRLISNASNSPKTIALTGRGRR